MNIKVKRNGGAQTVIVIGNEQPIEKNRSSEKSLDNLESKLNQQYKNYIEKGNRIVNKNFDALTKSITKSLGGFERALKDFKPEPNNNINKVLDSFTRKLDQQYKALIETKKNAKSTENDELTKSLLKSIESLEKTVKNIRLSPRNNGNISKQFEKMASRLETALMKVRPRMMPSPS